jgi:predicted negative regulator of RcsB-dependent stress response
LAAKRLTRKEIVRQDRIQQTLTETSGFLVRNLKHIFVGVALLLVAIAATYLWRTYQSSVQEELQAKFSDALAKYHASVTETDADELPDPAGSESAELPGTKYEYATPEERSEQAREAFQELSEEYSGRRLGLLSQYYVGLTLVDLKRLDEAKTELKVVADNLDYKDIANMARNTLVQVAVSEGNAEEAIRLLNQILDEPSRNFPQQVVLARLAQNYEAVEDYQSALRSYRRISAEHAGSALANKAQARIDYFRLRGITVEEDAEEEEEPSEPSE